MAVDKPSAPTPLPASDMHSNAPTLRQLGLGLVTVFNAAQRAGAPRFPKRTPTVFNQLNQWIFARGGVAANEDQQAIRQVRSFIEQHGESRFTPKQTGYSSQVRQRAGWLGRSCASMRSRHTVHPEHNTSGPQTLYLFYPTG